MLALIAVFDIAASP